MVWHIGAVKRGTKQSPHTTYRTDVPESRVQVGGIDKEKTIQVTLNSGGGASRWPAGLLTEVPMKPKLKGVRFRAANGEDLQ